MVYPRLLLCTPVQVSRLGWLWQRGGENKQSERIAALEQAVEGLDSRARLIKVEWESVLDKVNSVMGRLNARIRKFEDTSAPVSDAQGPTQAELPAGVPGSHGTLMAMRGRRRGVLSG